MRDKIFNTYYRIPKEIKKQQLVRIFKIETSNNLNYNRVFNNFCVLFGLQRFKHKTVVKLN